MELGVSWPGPTVSKEPGGGWSLEPLLGSSGRDDELQEPSAPLGGSLVWPSNFVREIKSPGHLEVLLLMVGVEVLTNLFRTQKPEDTFYVY